MGSRFKGVVSRRGGWGESQQQERKRAGHTASAVRKQRTKMAGEGDGNTRGSAHRLGAISLPGMNWG